mgnify:CR=1 FL=1
MKLSSQISSSFTRVFRGSLSGVVMAMAVMAAPVSAQTKHVGHTHGPNGEIVPDSPTKNYVTTNQSGMVVVLDRDTGKARPLTAEESQKLAEGIKQLVNQSTEGLVQVRHADGSVSMDLQGRFQSVLLAKKEDDGTISQACVDNLDAATAFFEIDPKLVGILTNRARTWSNKLETR